MLLSLRRCHVIALEKVPSLLTTCYNELGGCPHTTELVISHIVLPPELHAFPLALSVPIDSSPMPGDAYPSSSSVMSSGEALPDVLSRVDVFLYAP